MRIKICGLTRADQAAHAAGCGADFVGVVAAESRRRVTLEEAREVARVRGDFPVRVVGVFQDQPRAKQPGCRVRKFGRFLDLLFVLLHESHDVMLRAIRFICHSILTSFESFHQSICRSKN